MAVVTITRVRNYDEVFSGPVTVPEGLRGGLRWIEAHCPLHVPTSVTTEQLAEAWNVPEGVVRLGLHALAETGYFNVTG